MTGGAGFIGTNLVNELKDRGHEVIALDLYNTDREGYIRADVRNYRQLERVFERWDFDYVYHLAAEYGRWDGEDCYEKPVGDQCHRDEAHAPSAGDDAGVLRRNWTNLPSDTTGGGVKASKD